MIARLSGLLIAGLAFGATAAAQPANPSTIDSADTQFDTDKNCKHTPGRQPEDYGTWLCQGYAGISVLLFAGDQRMTVSFGPRAKDEVAAGETFPQFNDVYKGTIEWRFERGADGKPEPFATILRWNYIVSGRQKPTGSALVVTRLGTGSVCQIGWVDARANADANAMARKVADEKARAFRCGVDRPEWVGKAPNKQPD